MARPIRLPLLVAAIGLLAAPGTAQGAECEGDVNGDNAVNVLDLIDLLLCFGQPDDPPCETGQDINCDTAVNVLDLIDLLLEFGQPCP